MRLVDFLKETENIMSVEEPEAIIMVGPSGSGKTHISEQYKKTHVIIDVDKLRDKPTEEELKLGEEHYRYSSQDAAEKKRDEILERMILKRKNIVMHVLTGSPYWYDQALNIKYSGYKVKFIFMLTTKAQVLENIEKRISKEREERGYAIIADENFINYSFENIPKLLLQTLKDEQDIVYEVMLSDQNGKIFKDYSKEDIYRALKTFYMK